MAPIREEALLSGSWFDPTHSGEGYNVEVLIDGQVVVYWFSYDPEGKRRWFFGLGEIREGKLVFDDMLTSSGGIFGPDFDPDDVEFKPWGSLGIGFDLQERHRDLQQYRRGFWFRHAQCRASDQHRPAALPIAEHSDTLTQSKPFIIAA